MKVCKRCFREFDENEDIDYSIARELGEIFVSSVGNVDIQDLCPQCREELGVMNLLGFGQ
ncbi:MAG: hypothetical protein ACLP9S_08370 [Syntrophales bacterium]|jgi:hypothetical protein